MLESTGRISRDGTVVTVVMPDCGPSSLTGWWLFWVEQAEGLFMSTFSLRRPCSVLFEKDVALSTTGSRCCEAGYRGLAAVVPSDGFCEDSALCCSPAP